MPTDFASLVRRFLDEAWNGRNLHVIDELVAEDYAMYLWRQGIRQGGTIGVQGLKRHVAEYQKAFPDLHITLDELLVDGDRVMGRATFTGTQRGPFMGIPPTNKPVRFIMISIFRGAGAKLQEHATLLDALGLFQQLGKVPDTARLLGT